MSTATLSDQNQIALPDVVSSPHQRLVLRFPSEDPLDDDRFSNYCRLNPELRLERDSQGDLVIMSPAGGESSGSNFTLTGRLYVWVEKAGLGKAFDSSGGFTLPNGAIRSPDASWISTQRWNALSHQDRERFPPLCPEFVVEIRSRTDHLGELQDKMREYRDQGARLGWLIDPIRRVVEIYRPNSPVVVLEQPETLSGEDVLPGFLLELKGILDR